VGTSRTKLQRMAPTLNSGPWNVVLVVFLGLYNVFRAGAPPFPLVEGKAKLVVRMMKSRCTFKDDQNLGCSLDPSGYVLTTTTLRGCPNASAPRLGWASKENV